uniref:Uncharacterized protein n=1 Tax=Faxonius propinquus nudivirus TaxID=3139431 RepID=A0AAU8GCX0_9VIRU
MISSSKIAVPTNIILKFIKQDSEFMKYLLQIYSRKEIDEMFKFIKKYIANQKIPNKITNVNEISIHINKMITSYISQSSVLVNIIGIIETKIKEKISDIIENIQIQIIQKKIWEKKLNEIKK